MLRSVLLDKKLKVKKWRKLLPELVFALNCSESKATQSIPYEVVFGRKPILPLDVLLTCDDEYVPDDVITPSSYTEELNLQLKVIFENVIEKLHISKEKMQKEYNKKIRFNDYSNGEKVWLKKRFYKTDENRKLSPRRNGPWIVNCKLPNGVNFQITNEKTKEVKIVHHDRLSPFKVAPITDDNLPDTRARDVPPPEINDDSSTESGTDYESEFEIETDESDSDDGIIEDAGVRRYPTRNRTSREIPGAIPWSAIQL